MQDGQRKRGSNAKRRRGARQKAMQALYQWDFDCAAQEPARIVEQFCDLQNMDKVDVEYFQALFLYATEHCSEIDAELSLHTDRHLDKLDPIERAVLRICCTELKTQLQTPYKVIVNEALEISKDFGADKGFRYINGIADKLAASLRSTEYTRDHPHGNPVAQQSAQNAAHPTASNSAAGRAQNAAQNKVKITVKTPEPNSASQGDVKSAKKESAKKGKRSKSGTSGRSDSLHGKADHGKGKSKPDVKKTNDGESS